MKDALEDIRLLKLAEMYELAYEAFILEVAMRWIEDEDVQRKLLELEPPGQRQYERIVTKLDELNDLLGPQDRADIQRAALLDILEVERAAWDFYRENAGRVREPGVRELFETMAAEEGRHVKIAEEALAMVDGDEGEDDSLDGGEPDDASRFRLRMTELLLREGVSDHGARRSGRGMR